MSPRLLRNGGHAKPIWYQQDFSDESDDVAPASQQVQSLSEKIGLDIPAIVLEA